MSTDVRILRATERARSNSRHTDPIHTDDVELIAATLAELDQQAWRTENARLANRLELATAENYPAGAEDAAKIATVLWRGGMLYAINAAVLHPLGLALGVNVTEDGTDCATGLFLAGTHEPEGINFDEQDHAEGMAKLHDVALPLLVSSLETTYARFAKELERRQRDKAGESDADAPNGA